MKAEGAALVFLGFFFCFTSVTAAAEKDGHMSKSWQIEKEQPLKAAWQTSVNHHHALE